jgi:transcriptional regulator with XRE-family HTH domain
MDKTVRTLGERIKELRDEKDLSLREFAKQLGDLSAAFLSDIELGRRYPSDKVLSEMAKVLGTSIDDLRSFDNRAPMSELKKLASANPAYGLALRKMVDMGVSPEEMIKLAERKGKGKSR